MPFKSKVNHAIYQREWKKRNPEKRLNHERNANKKAKEEIFKILGKKCSKCGFDDIRALQVDHKNGDGYKDRHSRSVRKVFYKIRKSPRGFQMLCANCNWIKRVENKEYAISK
ncbi:hypothetical protein HZB96_05880 [Candidatus Gottesmanbacteria bacterium]|nr:hypothetical protein [Candidatus Gottesmanbacteria bacterium]MBI5732616.1 hypothetical protein [Candidatus Jorgensenbacteria bacterium]